MNMLGRPSVSSLVTFTRSSTWPWFWPSASILSCFSTRYLPIIEFNACTVLSTVDQCDECFGRLRTLLTEMLKTKLAEKLVEKLVDRPRQKEVED